MIGALLLTFVCGAAYEGTAVFWAHYSERGDGLRAALSSTACALVACVGFGEALHRPAMITAYALGFGAGTYVAVAIKRQLRKIRFEKAHARILERHAKALERLSKENDSCDAS